MKNDHPDLTIIDYHPKYKSKYKELNEEWLNKYFSLETIDQKILTNPEGEILNKNGHIFFALSNDKTIGTCTLLKLNMNTYELSKMCVTSKYQGKGVGEKLLNKAISFALNKGAQRIRLLTNSKLKSAVHLYKKMGFREIEKPIDSENESFIRESTYMILDLTQE